MNDHRRLAVENPLLAPLGAETIRKCLEDGRFVIKKWQKGQLPHLSDELCVRMEIILEGKVAVERIDEDGNLMAVAEFSRQEMIGGNLIFSRTPHYPMTITAKEDTVILSVEKDPLLALLSEYPAFLKAFLEYIADHAVLLSDRIKHYANRTIRECLTNFLLYEKKLQESDCIVLPMTKKALAEKIGVQRTSVSRELAKMEQDGLLVCSGRSIDIKPALTENE